MNYRWASQGLNWVLERTPDVWSFVELTTGKELFQEGQEQRHCVASYAVRCVAGHSAIVSLRWNDNRRVTIELHPKSKQVIQVRGPSNCQPNAEEQSVITLWIKECVRPGGP